MDSEIQWAAKDAVGTEPSQIGIGTSMHNNRTFTALIIRGTFDALTHQGHRREQPQDLRLQVVGKKFDTADYTSETEIGFGIGAVWSSVLTKPGSGFILGKSATIVESHPV